jgi:hypothetical protein
MNKDIIITIVVGNPEALIEEDGTEAWLEEMAREISDGLMGHLEKLRIKYADRE